MKPKILVSACLMGKNCKYNGGNNKSDSTELMKLRDEGRLVFVCPEEMGGLSTPRPPSEIRGDKVINNIGADVTAQFCRGGDIALSKAKENNIFVAILKQSSPSCGSKTIYDGSFSGTKIPGMGITVKKLRKAGIEVFDENHIKDAIEYADKRSKNYE